jgi:hypothetical protein
MNAMPDSRNNQPAAAVDFLVDENGRKLDVRDGSTIRAARETEESVGAVGPTNWWRLGLVALGAVALVLLLMQLFGGTPGTDVQTGTPVAQPEVTVPEV